MAVSSRKSQNCPQLDPLPPCWHHVGWKKNNLTFFSQFKRLRVCMKKLPLHVRPMLNGIMTLWDRRRFFVTKITQKLSRGLTEFWGWKFCVQGCTAVVWIKKKTRWCFDCEKRKWKTLPVVWWWAVPGASSLWALRCSEATSNYYSNRKKKATLRLF